MHPKVSKFDDVKKKIHILSAEERDPKHFFAKLTTLLRDGCRYNTASVYTIAGDKAVLEGFAGSPHQALPERPIAGHFAQAAETPKPLILSNIEMAVQQAENIDGMRSRIMMPVKQSDRMVAIVEARSTGTRNFDEVDAHLLEEVAKLMAARMQ